MSWCSTYRRYFVFVSIVVSVALLIAFMFEFVDVAMYRGMIYPSRPTFRVGSESSLNSLTVNGTQLIAEFNISVSADNPTSYSRVYYDAVSVEVFYRGEGLVLSKTSLPSFTTHKKSTIHMTLSVNSSWDFGGAATSIAHSRKDGKVEFGLIVSSLIKYKNNIFQSKWVPMKVVCNPLKFAVSPNDYNTTTGGVLLEGLTCTST